MGIRDRPTSPRSPWQNAYAERLIGSIRGECLDHVVVFGERHLRHVLLSYMNYYNETRTHLSLDKDAPLSAVQRAGAFFAFQSWASCIINIFGFDLRQAQPSKNDATSASHHPRPRQRCCAAGPIRGPSHATAMLALSDNASPLCRNPNNMKVKYS